MYAEFVACYEAMVQAKWLKKFVPKLKVVDSIQRTLKMYYDNEQCFMPITISQVVLCQTH
jgi:hypothetical protein